MTELQKQTESSLSIEQSRAVQEVQGAMLVAKKFPRDVEQARDRILTACCRKALAEQAIYTYPRGTQQVEGPSIRLAEAIAQAWGNLQFGVRELSQEQGFSHVEAYAWDLETNTRQIKNFRVRHWRDTKGGGYPLRDARDIYEKVANDGARRLRACILGVIPGDIVEDAVAQCRTTLVAGEKEPLEKRIKAMVSAFGKDWNVTMPQIEEYLGHKLAAITEYEMVRLKGVYRSLKDGMSEPSDHFSFAAQAKGKASAASAAAELTSRGDPLPNHLDPERGEKAPKRDSGEHKPSAHKTGAQEQNSPTDGALDPADGAGMLFPPELPGDLDAKIGQYDVLRAAHEQFTIAFRALPMDPTALQVIYMQCRASWVAMAKKDECVGELKAIKDLFWTAADEAGYPQPEK